MADGAVVSLWRYPVKSMLGEELTDRGLLGDRSLALVDTETAKVVSAKNPKKWSTCSTSGLSSPRHRSWGTRSHRSGRPSPTA